MTETAKFYTKARRIPMLVGKLPSGGRIWGGPYTITQVAAGALVAFVLWQSTSVWARLGGIMNVVVATGLVVGTIWAVGKLPSGGRNPISLAMDAMNLTSSPGHLMRGQVALPKPRLMTNRVMVVLPKGYIDAEWRIAQAAALAEQARPAAVEPTPAEPAPAGLLPELTGRGPADTTYEGRQLGPRPDELPQPVAARRSPSDWTAAAATAAATATERKTADLTGIGQLLAGKLPKDERTTPPTPRED